MAHPNNDTLDDGGPVQSKTGLIITNQDGLLDSDNEELPQGHKATSSSEKRRAQNAKFSAWLLQNAERDMTRDIAKAELKDAADEELSIRNLMAKQDSGVVLKDPREYQIELFERAKLQNTIAVLDTGSGKTLIAVLLLRWVIDQELEDRVNGKAPRISFFLVASVTLVFQQFAVLECNIDHKIDRFCGAMNTDLWTRKIWEKHLAENKVIVCTADVLLSCLMHGFITMRQINLLIFDEAHHTKKNHSYARIVKDYYKAESDKSILPRIFGMTASPVDAKVDVKQAAIELENLLDSRIATTADMTLVSKAVSRPTEKILQYASAVKPFETQLHLALKTAFGGEPCFEAIFERAKQISSHLGRWCSDTYLKYALNDDKVRKLEMRIERKFHARRADKDVAELDDQLAEVRNASSMAQQYVLLPPKLDTYDLNSKVLELKYWLSGRYERPSDHRCIVFVDKRHTARLLHLLFKEIGGQHIRSAFLIGANQTDFDEDSVSFRQQVLTLAKFRKGEINCLFATSVAEEGLDVPDCNIVVRFDMYKTMIQYVQSRGRARHKNSTFIHMIEIRNSTHVQVMQEVMHAEQTMRSFCQSLPEDRRLIGNEDSLETESAKEKNQRVYKEPSTGAKLTYGNALAVLAHFVSAIPTESEDIPSPTYIISSQGGKFIAEVRLPSNSPLQFAIGRTCSRKALARRSAAFEACIKLRENKYLNEDLLPIYQKRLPVMRNAMLALNMKHSNKYTMRVKPSLWEEGKGTMPTELHMLILDFPEGLDRPHHPLAMLTRCAVPKLPNFPIYLNNGRVTQAVLTVYPATIAASEEDLEKLTILTLRMFKDMHNKTFEHEVKNMSYWLAPVIPNLAINNTPPSVALDWSSLNEVYVTEEYQWTPETPADFLKDRFLIDRWDGGRRFYSKCVDPSLRPVDPVPEHTAVGRFNDNILDYSVSLFKKSRLKATWIEDQPVLEAEKLPTRLNMLAEPNDEEKSLRTRCFLCPEPLKISVLQTTFVAIAFYWPAVIHRLESYLIALEGASSLGFNVDPALALEAFTKDSDNSGEHENQERVNFQSGMGPNYERLEFLGDCFLKMATSVAVFIQNPNDNEFEFHVKRMLMLCNQNLFNVAQKAHVHEYIRSVAFSRRSWYPKGLKLLEGKGSKADGDEVKKHTLGDKTVADVCEALIGAAFLQHDEPGAWKAGQWDAAVKAVTTLVGSEDHLMQKWTDYKNAYEIPEYQKSTDKTGNMKVTTSQNDLAEKVEHEHSYRFRYPRLLRSAFIHSSYPFSWETVPSYQRLEFLGDSLLDMACISHLFYRFPDKDPQWLTEHKMAMVSNKFLGAVCVKIGFYRHLRYNTSLLEHQIREYVLEVQQAEREARGAKDYWIGVSDPPKCLPDIVESYVGAMFIDSDFDYNAVQRFFDTHIKPYFVDMALYNTFANNHPCTHLRNMLQTTYGCHDYRLMAREIPGVDATGPPMVIAVVLIHDEFVGETRGKSARYGRMRAAQGAMESIKGLAPYEFRARFGCSCADADDGAAEVECPDLDALPVDCGI